MKDITVIVPIYNLNESTDKVLVERAINSIPYGMPTIVVGNTKDIEIFNKFIENNDVNIIENNDNTTLPSQINLAVQRVKTKYFSVLEFDDTFTDKWFNNVNTYSKDINEDVIAYLPLTEIVSFKTNDILGYANEAFWASSFSEELGFMDINCIQDYLNINTHGGVFNTEVFKELGALKPSMKILYWYEFALRALYKGKKIFIIPKVGYIHTVERPGCASDTIEMNQHEFEWWLDLANKEYFFQTDRNKTYKEE